MERGYFVASFSDGNFEVPYADRFEARGQVWVVHRPREAEWAEWSDDDRRLQLSPSYWKVSEETSGLAMPANFYPCRTVAAARAAALEALDRLRMDDAELEAKVCAGRAMKAMRPMAGRLEVPPRKAKEGTR